MRKLLVFNFATLNGFFSGVNGDLSWHRHGEEENAYAAEGVQSESILMFGRVTYQMMASFWPTPMAMERDPIVAAGMNKAEKIVFSNSLKKADWQNTRIVGGNIIEDMKKLKQTSGKDMTVLGSGSIVTQFAEAGLVDEFQIMVDPVVLGSGTPLFNNIKRKLDLRLTSTRSFKSGVVLLSYTPMTT